MNVVIVGGGFCGIYVAKQLDNYPDINTILIDKNPFFQYSPSLHKAITDRSYLKKLEIKYKDILKNISIIPETVKQITPKYIKTEKQKIFFDYLVIATGIDYPITIQNTQNTYVLKKGSDALAIEKKLQTSTHLLIVGGGVIGTEIAGELVTKLTDKNITIVHARQHLLERTSSDAWEYAEEFLKKKGVSFFFSEKVISQTFGVFHTNRNHDIPADLCIWCAGIQQNPTYMDGFEQECFSKERALIVNEYLQLRGYPHIFAGGDINNVKVEKTAHHAKIQGKSIAKNILLIHKNKQLKPYKKPYSVQIIGLGDWRGIIYIKRVIVGLMIPGIIKWFIEKMTMSQLKKRW